jgi:hypothetical protein
MQSEYNIHFFYFQQKKTLSVFSKYTLYTVQLVNFLSIGAEIGL